MSTLQERLLRVKQNRACKAANICCLLFALFAGNLLLIINCPDDPSNRIFDILMVVAFVFFVLEIALNLSTDRSYPLSFFCAMDVLGTASLLFEVSFIFGSAGKAGMDDSTVDPVIMRTARVAKLSSRAARLLKLVKMLGFLLRRRQASTGQNADTATLLGHKLRNALATRVSLFTLLLVIIIPMFRLGQYPEEDLSLKAWGRLLEETYLEAHDALEADPSANETQLFAVVVEDMMRFYSSISYFPYKLEGYEELVVMANRSARILGASAFGGPDARPARYQNEFIQVASECLVPREGCSQGGPRASVHFNFEDSKRKEAATEIAMICFVILIMAAVTSDFTRTVDALVLKPLERMLAMVREFASTILTLAEGAPVSTTTGGAGGGPHLTQKRTSLLIAPATMTEAPDEMELLSHAFEKLSALSAINLRQRTVDRDMLQGLGIEARGVMLDIMRMEEERKELEIMSVLRSATTHTSTSTSAPSVGNAGSVYSVGGAGAVGRLTSVISDDGEFDFNSWELDVLSLSRDQLRVLAQRIFFSSPIGVQTGIIFTTTPIFSAFFVDTMQGYLDMPYHNAFHACDVLHSVHAPCACAAMLGRKRPFRCPNGATKRREAEAVFA